MPVTEQGEALLTHAVFFVGLLIVVAAGVSSARLFRVIHAYCRAEYGVMRPGTGSAPGFFTIVTRAAHEDTAEMREIRRHGRMWIAWIATLSAYGAIGQGITLIMR